MADEDQRWPNQIEHDRQRRILPHIFFSCLIFSKPQSTGICLYSNPPEDNSPDPKRMGAWISVSRPANARRLVSITFPDGNWLLPDHRFSSVEPGENFRVLKGRTRQCVAQRIRTDRLAFRSTKASQSVTHRGITYTHSLKYG